VIGQLLPPHAAQEPSTVMEMQKAQWVRLWDVFFLAPFLGYIAWTGKLSRWQQVTLGAIAVATAYYNGRNYLANIRGA
jgi:hypothetical protein